MCGTCNKHLVNTNPAPKPIPMEVSEIIPNETNMLTYIQSFGWQYNGDCGCKNNYSTYINHTDKKYSMYRIWLPKAPKPLNNMQIRVVANRSTSIIDTAGLLNWKQVYDNRFNINQ